MANITDTDVLTDIIAKGKTTAPGEWAEGFNAGLVFAINRAKNNCIQVEEMDQYNYGYISATAKALAIANQFIEDNEKFYKFVHELCLRD